MATRKRSGQVKLRSVGSSNPPEAAIPEDVVARLRACIAEAAYYRAEKRNFAPGRELQDWLEAERDITAAPTASHGA